MNDCRAIDDRQLRQMLCTIMASIAGIIYRVAEPLLAAIDKREVGIQI